MCDHILGVRRIPRLAKAGRPAIGEGRDRVDDQIARATRTIFGRRRLPSRSRTSSGHGASSLWPGRANPAGRIAATSSPARIRFRGNPRALRSSALRPRAAAWTGASEKTLNRIEDRISRRSTSTRTPTRVLPRARADRDESLFRKSDDASSARRRLARTT